MNQNHKEVFWRVAQDEMCWIGLREPNPLSEKWIGRPGHMPKGEACKAKTADNPSFKHAGLVADPTVCPEAFTRSTLSLAIETWKRKFLKGGRMPAGYTVVDKGPQKGLVKHRAAYIFADYDLMALTRASESGEFLTTSNDEEATLYRAVAPALNRGLGCPMIQHGTEFMWSGGVGARESEFVLWFGPGRRLNRWPSSMPRGGH